MNQLLLKATICCAALLPFSQAQAKTFGDFKVGQTFTLTVSHRSALKTVGFKTSKSKIPTNVPNFAVGDKVKFTIGKGGKLTGEKFALPLKATSISSNSYLIPFTASNIYKSRAATINKDTTTHAAIGGSLTFINIKPDGFQTSTTTVTYVFND